MNNPQHHQWTSLAPRVLVISLCLLQKQSVLAAKNAVKKAITHPDAVNL
jgi:hypothetical protein